jgi:hypothetical protein
MASSSCCLRVRGERIGILFWLLCLSVEVRADEAPEFFRGLNLNGTSVVIDGNVWEGSESKSYICHDKAFDHPSAVLTPTTDTDRARMIRSSRYGGNRVELIDIPPGIYTLFLYVWEDNDSETYSVSVNARQVQGRHNSGMAGHWDKLGPWPVTVKPNGKIVITSQGGTANFSGIELWKGHFEDRKVSISDDDLAFFEKRIRPVLVDRCYECHSAESAELQGGLLVDSRETLLRGGAKGPAIVPGDVNHSLLIEAVRFGNDSMQMPPDGKLSDAEIADLEQWVRLGAPDPRTTATTHQGKQIDIEAARDFWSMKPIANPSLPAVKRDDWPLNDLDRFILARQEGQELTPAADADKRVLLRRATYDLIGLPPTPEEIDAFIADESGDAFEPIVERLLASPRYGERWGRHWLDVVRYADTAGDNSDYPIPQNRHYRDWVIAAFNRDQPYDEFVRDQLAGDLRGGSTEEERNSRIIATGYLANARRFGSRVVDYPQHLTIEDTIDNLGRTFLGLTLSCARCHDHKFDPITNRDYYGLYGIFHSTRYPWPGIELDKRQRDFVPLISSAKQTEMEQALAARVSEQARLDAEVENLRKALKQTADAEKKGIEQKLKAAEKLAKAHLGLPPLIETAYAVADSEAPEDVAIQLRGDPTRPGDVVSRRFLTVLGGHELPPDHNASGREQLAEWILGAENPLPARVMVNRIWQYHFGRGLVPTPNDFGRQGKPPTHPELLDYLATQFRARGWSIKSMHRLIMLSRTYQQSSARTALAIEQDPANEWLSGFTRRRLDAESIRDTLLVLGGNLDLTPPGPHPFPPQRKWNFTQHNPFKAVYESNHRSVYLMTQRIQRHPFLAIFDGADPSTSTASRMTSTTPLQALYLLNDEFVHNQANGLANRLLADSNDDESRIERAWLMMFGRRPEPDETRKAQEFLTETGKLLEADGEHSDILEQQRWQAFVRSLMRLSEFVYLD